VWLLLVVLFFLAGIALAGATYFFRSVEPPIDAMNRFLRDVDHGQYDAAYDQLCRQEQAATARSDFPDAIAPFAGRMHNFNVYSFDPFGDHRSVEYWITDADGDRTSYTATIVREGGAWRVCDFFE
jgi:hypothetical protein